MKKLILSLGMALLPALTFAQVIDDKEDGLRYGGVNYFIVAGDSLMVKNLYNRNDSITIEPQLVFKNKTYPVKGLKRSAFERFWELEYVNLPACIKTIPNSCFASCNRLTEVIMPGVEEIDPYGFFRTRLEEFVAPDGLKKIWDYAFNGCSRLSFVELPETLEWIDENAFVHCNNLDVVKVKFSQPIEIHKDAFWLIRPNWSRRPIKLLVPAGSKEAFQSDPNWGRFNPIEEY